MFLTMFKGFSIGLSLICAIGAQNAFVLKQGLLKNNIFWICTTCFICDFFLMCMGIFGVGEIISANKILLFILTFAGAIFLIWYGFLSFRSALRGNSNLTLDQNGTKKTSVFQSIMATLGITLLNPHVYLDTVVIIGGVSVTIVDNIEKVFFMIGVMLASGIWFYSLGYGAQKLLVYFMRPKVWRVIEMIIAFIMWIIALTLFLYIVHNYSI